MARIPITIMGFKCERCGHEWVPRDSEGEPKVCPKCHSPWWQRPATPPPDVTEAEIADVVVAILRERPDHKASVAELIKEIPERIELSAADLAQSPTRPNEPLWHQRVRNIRSHKRSRGNAIHDRRLVAIPGGFALPSKAR
jgi:hypothetical protein